MARAILRSVVAAVAFATASGSIPGAVAEPAHVDSAALAPARPAAAGEAVQFDIFFPLRDQAGLDALLEAQQDPASAEYQHWLSPAEFTTRFGVDPATLERARALLGAAGMQIVSSHAHGLRVSTTAGQLQAQWGVALDHVAAAGGPDRLQARGGFTLPDALQTLGGKVVAFKGPVRALTHSQKVLGPVPLNRFSAIGGYFFTDLKQAYDAPTYQVLNGSGRTIAILMAGDVLDSDTATYFNNEGLAAPNVEHIYVNGGAFFDPNSSGSFEASLDVQQSGGMAPLATIRLYDVPSLSNSDTIDGLIAIVDDNVADVASMSFGECENFFTAEWNGGVDESGVIRLYEQIFKQGNAQGITFAASSGDFGGLQCIGIEGASFVKGASHPATSPSVTAVGGTNLITNFVPGSLDSTYLIEHAYGDPLVPNDPYGFGVAASGGFWGSGGGTSLFFGRPSWQQVGLGNRATPDLSLHMGGCPGIAVMPCGGLRSFDLEVLGGQYVGVVGTSASAPAFAGVAAMYDQATKARHGNLNPMIYQLSVTQGMNPVGPYHRFIQGFNGLFSTAQASPLPGITLPENLLYNMVVGNGSLDIRRFLGVTFLPAAGEPGSPSNP